jgi:hypothetical protein
MKVSVVSSVLGQELGWLWPIFFLKCLIRKNALFKKIRQSKVGEAKSDYDNTLALCAAAYIELAAKFGKEKAVEIMRKIIVPIGCSETLDLLQSLELSREKPMALLISYFELVDKKGAGRFCKREITYDDNTCHRVVTQCPFHDFLTEAGTPELTGLFCEVDKAFYSSAFPEFRFHRNGSWENTIAYGKDHCEFVFELAPKNQASLR